MIQHYDIVTASYSSTCYVCQSGRTSYGTEQRYSLSVMALFTVLRNSHSATTSSAMTLSQCYCIMTELRNFLSGTSLSVATAFHSATEVRSSNTGSTSIVKILLLTSKLETLTELPTRDVYVIFRVVIEMRAHM